MSPFLTLPASAHVAANALAFAIRDRYPVAEGHTLVIPRREVATWFEATREEQLAILALVDVVKAQLDEALRPDGYNVGFNAGEAAGQTVFHLHVHVIPRFRGDVDDPRGGVRHVIPGKGNYLRAAPPELSTGGEGDPFARHVLPLLAVATDVAIVSAFVQASGLRRITDALDQALAKGARVRLVTGDYLEITQADALETLLDWQATTTLQARVVETAKLPGRSRSFHPKAWRLVGDGFAVAFVGSSNLSHAALTTGIEWNLRVDRGTRPAAFARIGDAFEALWDEATPLTDAWVAAYAARARARPQALPPGEVVAEARDPHEVQEDALAALRAAREAGRRRALVVLATGLGKTWLAAFDYQQLWDELGRQPRLLFLAHRRELLFQAAATFRRIVHDRRGDARVGWVVEDRADHDATLVFASTQKLGRALEALQPFDYVVVDEAHHATAASYRKILDRLDPAFLLGLTATPDRADAADVLGLFDDFTAYEAGIGRGIALGRLVPFRYFGVKDDIDYANIPWRNRRFDPEKLAEAAQTEARMATLWGAWSAHPGTKTLVFCCSIPHAAFAADWLRAKGVRVACVHSQAGSDDRDGSLDDLAAGRLDAVCAVDLFNEGVDVPTIDRVVMLRPTESGVVFLQQLGRGLRAADGKAALTVIDFVGNHALFLDRLRTLLSLGDKDPAARLTRLIADGHVDLPDGCSVELALEAKPLLEARFRSGGADAVIAAYRRLREARGARPTAGELSRSGYNLGVLRQRYGGWFRFVRSEGDLSEDEGRALDAAGAFLDDLEITPMSKSFKMVTLQVLLDEDALFTGLRVPTIANAAWARLSRSPELLVDVPEGHRPARGDDRAWVAYWRKNPIQAWARPERGRPWFDLDADDVLRLRGEPVGALAGLVHELVDDRLARYRRRSEATNVDGFVCKVLWNQRDPILKLPKRDGKVPEGETDVRLPDGAVWTFRFAKEYVNVARPVGTADNRLPDLLRRWFGPAAGHPGTHFEVRFEASPDGLWVKPVGERAEVIPVRFGVTAYPDLRAAAGHALGEAEAPEPDVVLLPIEADADRFAVRVTGTSMDGGQAPLRDGDWAVFQLARGAPAAAVDGRVVLVQVPGEAGHAWQIKRVKRDGSGWRLTSDNPDGPSFAATEDMVVIARLDRAFRPEDLAPAVGAVIAEEELGQAFGVPGLAARSGVWGGHRFVFVDQPGGLVAVDRVVDGGARRPGETVFVLARGDGGWRFCGVGRADGGGWRIPEVDYATWKTWGDGRGVSRVLPDGVIAKAQAVVDAWMALPEERRVVDRGGGRTARVIGIAAKGGLRLDPGDGASERVISLVDLGWVIVAAEAVAREGGVLDEERVNRVRYLEGTPKGGTRWIDTGWALPLAGQLDHR